MIGGLSRVAQALSHPASRPTASRRAWRLLRETLGEGAYRRFRRRQPVDVVAWDGQVYRLRLRPQGDVVIQKRVKGGTWYRGWASLDAGHAKRYPMGDLVASFILWIRVRGTQIRRGCGHLEPKGH